MKSTGCRNRRSLFHWATNFVLLASAFIGASCGSSATSSAEDSSVAKKEVAGREHENEDEPASKMDNQAETKKAEKRYRTPSPNYDHTFCLVSHYTDQSRAYAEQATATQARYAELRGYGYEVFVGRISGEQFLDPTAGDENDILGGGLYWQKVFATKRILEQGVTTRDGNTESCEWAFWLDSDACVTNGSIDLDDILAEFAPAIDSNDKIPVDIILSGEGAHPVNAGAFLVHNTPEGHSFLDALTDLYPLYRKNMLPEQTAMATLAYLAEPWPSEFGLSGLKPTVHPSFAIIPQRTFNSFYSTTWDFGEHAAWKPGDFVAHFAGTLRRQRAGIMREFLASLPPLQ